MANGISRNTGSRWLNGRNGLAQRWSPQQVCQARKKRFPGEPIRQLVHETIYRALYKLSIRPVPSGSARL